jgi:hypothetical protein
MSTSTAHAHMRVTIAIGEAGGQSPTGRIRRIAKRATASRDFASTAARCLVCSCQSARDGDSACRTTRGHASRAMDASRWPNRPADGRRPSLGGLAGEGKLLDGRLLIPWPGIRAEVWRRSTDRPRRAARRSSASSHKERCAATETRSYTTCGDTKRVGGGKEGVVFGPHHSPSLAVTETLPAPSPRSTGASQACVSRRGRYCPCRRHSALGYHSPAD